MTSEKNRKGTSTRRSVGAYGSKRGTPNKQVARRQHRAEDGRVRESMGEARAAEKQLDRRVAREQEQPALGETPGARYARERREREAREAQAREQEERLREVDEQRARAATPEPLYRWESLPGCWEVREARKMLRDGYTIVHVMRVTKVGFRWLDDFALDSQGRAIVRD